MDGSARSTLPDLPPQDRQAPLDAELDHGVSICRVTGRIGILVDTGMSKNINRMLVAPEQSHTTEQRLIEDKMVEGIKSLKSQTSQLDDELFGGDWESARKTAHTISVCCEYMATLSYRLEDVKGINAQFARIQAHIDRLESQNKEK